MRSWLLASATAGLTSALAPSVALAQSETALGTNRPLQLPPDSPYRDPDIVYLEADELINDEAAKTLTAVGSVVGRYQDRELRAERVIYNLESGEIFAEGNVTIVDPTGAAQFAEKVNLSNELQAGTATNFTLRTADGGLTAAALAQQNDDGSIDLFNAYYTACEVCADDPTPTWRIKARRVSQDKERKAIYYRDAVFELMGIPVMYTPFLAHPDPSAERASGFLTPLLGYTGDKGGFIRQPYFLAVDPYTDLTFTPRIFTGQNPVLETELERQFATGRVNVETSFGYGSAFDRNGNNFRDPDQFTDPDTAPVGRKFRGHVFADGRFRPSDEWIYGFGVELATDPLYVENYDFDIFPDTRGLFEGDAFRFINQAYIVGQGEDWRFSASAFGFQSQRARVVERGDLFRYTEEDNDTLPIVAPRLDVARVFDTGFGRFEANGNAVHLTRQDGVDYTRGTATVGWSVRFVVPGGLEVEPFALARLDAYELDPGIEDADQSRDFTRGLGYVGLDARYPFIKPGEVDIIVEPRLQVTQSFGDGKLENFVADNESGGVLDLRQDSLAVDLDPSLLFDPNKSTGYDFWQQATRVDAGGKVAARWDSSEVSLFVGKSWADVKNTDYDVTSGLFGNSSDIVGELRGNLGSNFRASTRVRYDDSSNTLRRIDADAFARVDKLSASARYFRSQGATPIDILDPTAPSEEISGSVRWKVTDNWSTSYVANFDIDRDEFRRQSVGLTYTDDCTRVDLIYTRNNATSGRVRGGDGFAIRITLATLGSID